MRPPLLLLAVSTILVFSIIAGSSNAFGKGQSLPVVTSKQYGYGLEQSREGIPLLISKTFFNVDNVTQDIAVIFDVRKDDISMHLFWKEEAALSRAMTFVSVTWAPQIAGEYQIRAFVISNLTNPEVLEDVTMVSFNIMSDEDFMALYSDRPTGFDITPIDSVPTSAHPTNIKFGEIQQFGSGLSSPNTFIENISVSDNGLYLIGVTEVPPLRENPPEGGGNELVFFSASNDRGSTFGPAKYLVNNTRALTFTRNPIIHPVNDTMLYASWLQEAYAKKEFKLIFSRSLDGGKTFEHTIRSNATSFGSLDMDVSKDGSSLYIVRTEAYGNGEPYRTAVLMSRSSDFGKSLGVDQVILNYTGSEYLSCAQIREQDAVGDSSNNIVYVTWRQDSGEKYPVEYRNMKILFAASYDDGETFSQPVVIREAYAEDYDCPAFAANGDDVYLFWSETKLIYKPEDPTEILVGDSDIFFAASRDSGISFESPVNVSEGIGAFTIEPKMLVSEGRIYVIWRDTIPEISGEGFLTYYGNADVVMARSLDGGRTFEAPVNLSNNPSGSYLPDIAVHGDNVIAVWLESTFPSNAAKVSMIISNDGGKTFGKVHELLPLMSESYWPQVLTSPDGQNLYVVWWQRQEDTSIAEIYALSGDFVLQ